MRAGPHPKDNDLVAGTGGRLAAIVSRRLRIDPGVLLFLTPVLWGATFPAGKRALEELPELPFMAWNRLTGFVAIVATMPLVARRVSAAEVRRVIAPGVVLGVLMFAAYNFQTYGLDRTTATNAGFITGLYVVFTPLLGLALFRSPVSRAGWVAVLLSLLGLCLLSFVSLEGLRLRVGDLLILVSTLGWAGHVVAMGVFAPRHPPLLLGAAQMGVAAALHLAASAATGLRPAQAASVWGLLLVTGLLGSGLAWTLQVVAQRELSVARAAIILAGESVFAAAFSFVWLGERLGALQWIGAALALAAVVVSELGARRPSGQRLDPGAAV